MTPTTWILVAHPSVSNCISVRVIGLEVLDPCQALIPRTNYCHPRRPSALASHTTDPP